MLIAGSVIIGRREEGNKAGVEATTGIEPLLEGDGDGFRDEDGETEGDERVELNRVARNEDEGSGDEDAVLK